MVEARKFDEGVGDDPHIELQRISELRSSSPTPIPALDGFGAKYPVSTARARQSAMLTLRHALLHSFWIPEARSVAILAF